MDEERKFVKEVTDKNGEILYTKYRFVRSRYCNIFTTVIMSIIVGIFLYFFFSSSGTYISAWYLSFAVAVLLVYLISFPLNIRLDKKKIEIHGILEVTAIPLSNIKRIYRIDNKKMNWIFPLFGSYGFGGFFGYYFDIKRFKIVSMFATRLTNLFVIEDIYNEKYIISAPDVDNLIKSVRKLAFTVRKS